nr:FKBP-type peptidyl-prolyl cis-trans isomerase [uncultured Allomuricauda sp.]
MKYGVLVFICFAVALVSCKNDDNGGPDAIPPSLLSDVAPEDDETIRAFLNTHFYNYEEFETPPEGFDYRIVIDTIAGENADKRPLMEDAESVNVNVSSSFLGLDAEEENIVHTLYYIEAREGGGGSPTYADSTFVKYEGSLLNGTTFDQNSEFSWQVLPFTVRGYANGIAKMKAGTPDQIVDNPDGTYGIANSGIGLIIMPSGLGYFNSPTTSVIPRYAPLVFRVELGSFVEDTDSDNDGIPSIEEDLNGNGFLRDDNTDEDREPFNAIRPNYIDSDDDGDGIPTRDEISDGNGNIIKPYPDVDGDGVPDYLDPDN